MKREYNIEEGERESGRESESERVEGNVVQEQRKENGGR